MECTEFTGFHGVLSLFIEFFQLSLLGFTEFYRVEPGFTGFYWVLLGITGFTLALDGVYRVPTESFSLLLAKVNVSVDFTEFSWIQLVLF